MRECKFTRAHNIRILSHLDKQDTWEEIQASTRGSWIRTDVNWQIS